MYFRVPILMRYKVIFILMFLAWLASGYGADWRNLLGVFLIGLFLAAFLMYIGKGFFIFQKGLYVLPAYFYPWDKIHSARMINLGPVNSYILFSSRWFPWRGILPLTVTKHQKYLEILETVIPDNNEIKELVRTAIKAKDGIK